ncbi:hypothetical protein [Flintibacter muris]|uniref:hypothetical protein n=1 Tax=Flintibacter muris TaxID=2941327 RepID=UPI00203F146F|nr:hypothetical protein [Flintibacter muris]
MLVQAAMCDQFVIVCGEQRLNLSNGGVLHNFRKIFKINEHVIIGLSGAIEDNYYLFQEYINPDFTLKEGCLDSLEEVFDRVTARYQEMTAEGECDVFSLVCGWNGSGFQAKTFHIDSEHAGNSRITDVEPAHEKDGKLISCGDNRHYENFYYGVSRYGFDINGVQRAFREVLSKGVLFDEFIDKNAQFEVIRRPE